MSACVFVASLGMPGENDLEGLKKTEFWRIYQGFPIAFCIISIVLVVFFIRLEPPKFYIIQGDQLEALKSIKIIYHENEDHKEILEYLSLNTSQETDKITYK